MLTFLTAIKSHFVNRMNINQCSTPGDRAWWKRFVVAHSVGNKACITSYESVCEVEQMSVYQVCAQSQPPTRGKSYTLVVVGLKGYWEVVSTAIGLHVNATRID
jgi:hypothetical protein